MQHSIRQQLKMNAREFQSAVGCTLTKDGYLEICHVPAHPDAAPAEIEDMAAEAFESFLTDARRLGPLQRHTPEQRKEIGAAIREFREYAAKRRQSATNKIYF